jgi:electron transport complex protein RnfD
MYDVAIALLPAVGFGVAHFGLTALLVVIFTVASTILSEYIYESLMGRAVTISDGSALVTGLILALNMPPTVPLWMPVLGGVFAIVVVKQLYGGLGQNFMNPALAARCFLLISFTGQMSSFYDPAIDAVSSATPLALMRAQGLAGLAQVGGAASVVSAGGGALAASSGGGALAASLGGGVFSASSYWAGLSKLILGTIPGTIGEVSTVALLIGAAYMLVKGVINIRIPGVYILTFFLFYLVFGGFNLPMAFAQVFAGGLVFGAFFMATDYVTSPITPKGQVVFAIFLGVLTGVFRLMGGSPEGVSYAILLGNMVTPLIEKVTMPRAFGKEKVAKNKAVA